MRLFRREPENLNEGEGVAHGYEHYHNKEKGIVTKNRILNALIQSGNVLLDFGEGFYNRKVTKESKAMRWGMKLANFADQAGKNMDEQAKSKEPILPKNILGKE